MQKDDSVTVPVDPSFPQLVTGVSQIKSGVKIDFSLEDIYQFEELTSGSEVPFYENPIISHIRYNRIDKKIWCFLSANADIPSIPLRIYDKITNTWSNSTIQLSGSKMYGINNYEVEIDRYGDPVIFLQDSGDWWKINHQTLIPTALKMSHYPDPRNYSMNIYSLNWGDFVGVGRGNDSNSSKSFSKINVITKTETSVDVLKNAIGTYWVASNVQNNFTYFITSTGSTTGVHYRQFIYNESNNTITQCGYFNTNYIVTDISSFVNLGNGKCMYYGGTFGSPGSLYEVATYLFDAFTREILTIPPRFLYDLKRFGDYSLYTKPVCYDKDEGKLYVLNYDSTNSKNKFWGRVKTDFYNMPSSNSDIYNFPLDFTPFLNLGLKVYLTLNTPCYQWTGGEDNYQILRSERFEVTERIILKANRTNFSGIIEITQ